MRTARRPAASSPGDRASRSRSNCLSAPDLRDRFNRDFWLEERGYYALALDGEKLPVDSITSSPGQLLWSGIVDEAKAAAVAGHLLGDALFSGWEVRTIAVELRGLPGRWGRASATSEKEEVLG